MIPVMIVVYAVFGLWSAERFKEGACSMSLWLYASIVLLWPAYWIMNAIAADEPETEDGDESDDTEGN